MKKVQFSPKGFELIEHEGEMALLVKARSIPLLVERTVFSLYWVQREEYTLGGYVSRIIQIKDDGFEFVLRQFLAELHYHHMVYGIIYPSTRVLQYAHNFMEVSVSGGYWLNENEFLEREIKAVTYYRLKYVDRGNEHTFEYVVDV